MVYVSLLLVVGVWVLLNRTRAGLILRAVGENHDAAHALGYKVVRDPHGARSPSAAPWPAWAAPTSASCACRNGPRG